MHDGRLISKMLHCHSRKRLNGLMVISLNLVGPNAELACTRSHSLVAGKA